jgi:hypothetical protein
MRTKIRNAFEASEHDRLVRRERREFRAAYKAKRKAEHEWRREARAVMEQRWAEGARS